MPVKAFVNKIKKSEAQSKAILYRGIDCASRKLK